MFDVDSRAPLGLASLLLVTGITSTAAASVATDTGAGRLVIRNDMNVGFGLLTGLRGCCDFNVANDADGEMAFTFGSGFVLRPAADYFVMDSLSVGAALEFGFVDGIIGQEIFAFAIMPRAGYSIPLTDWLGFWPQASLGIGLRSAGGHTDAVVPIDFYAPFYFHIVDNFFFGVGPGITVQPVDPIAYWNLDFLRFSLGGSIDVAGTMDGAGGAAKQSKGAAK